jgi:PKD repeat protein
LVGAVLIFSGGTASAKQFATLRLLDGQVAVQRGNGAFETGQDGTSLREGDTVRTGPDGRASIEYFDGSLTRLDFDTSFTLVTLESLGDAPASRIIESSQAEGNSYHRVAELSDARSRFEIETPTATASVLGTGYAVLVDEGATTIAVMDGVVTARGSGGSVEIPTGEMAVVGSDGVVGPIQAIPPELLDGDWLTFNRCADHDTPACSEGDEGGHGGDGGGPGGDGGGPGGEGGGHEGPTGPSNGPGHREQGSVPPTSTTGAGGESGATGGSPPPPPLDRPPRAGFSATPRLGTAPLRVRFADTSHDPDGDPLTRHWSFGDGSARSGGQTPSHTYDDPGRYTVTLTVSDPKGKRDATSKVIRVGSAAAVFDHIVISPSNATIQPGGSRSYTAQAFDTDGGSMGNVTADTIFSIAPNGSCGGNTCTAQQPGAHTVTGTYRGDSDQATLMVQDEKPPPPPPPPSPPPPKVTCPAYALAFHVRPPANQPAGHQFNVQIRVDVIDDGSSDGPLGISLSLQGGAFSGGETSATWTGQGIVNFNHLTIDAPGSYAISASADCAISTDLTPITITDGSNGSAKTGGSALGLVVTVPWIRRRRRGR